MSRTKTTSIDELTIEGVVYVPKSTIPQRAIGREGMPYVMVRTYSAGVHCGYLQRRDGKEADLVDSIRIWRWTGAATLSQLATEGSNDHSGCKFGVPIDVVLTEAIEIIDMTETAKQNIQSVASWKQ